jgi:hypothetical protein
MGREQRIQFVLALVQRASAHYGVEYGADSRLDAEVGMLLRAGCTAFPDAYVQTIAALAVRRAGQVAPQSVVGDLAMPFEQAVFLTCEQYGQMTDAQQDAVEFNLAVHAGRHYGMRFDNTPAERTKLDDGITPLIQGSCALLPDLYVHPIVGRAVQAAAERARAAK